MKMWTNTTTIIIYKKKLLHQGFTFYIIFYNINLIILISISSFIVLCFRVHEIQVDYCKFNILISWDLFLKIVNYHVLYLKSISSNIFLENVCNKM